MIECTLVHHAVHQCIVYALIVNVLDAWLLDDVDNEGDAIDAGLSAAVWRFFHGGSTQLFSRGSLFFALFL